MDVNKLIQKIDKASEPYRKNLHFYHRFIGHRYLTVNHVFLDDFDFVLFFKYLEKHSKITDKIPPCMGYWLGNTNDLHEFYSDASEYINCSKNAIRFMLNVFYQLHYISVVKHRIVPFLPAKIVILLLKKPNVKQFHSSKLYRQKINFYSASATFHNTNY